MGGRVSVVIPVLNREDLVTRCLDSVWAQTLRPLDVIVVDNNSTDGSAAAVRRPLGVQPGLGFQAQDTHRADAGGLGCAKPRSGRGGDRIHHLFRL